MPRSSIGAVSQISSVSSIFSQPFWRPSESYQRTCCPPSSSTWLCSTSLSDNFSWLGFFLRSHRSSICAPCMPSSNGVLRLLVDRSKTHWCALSYPIWTTLVEPSRTSRSTDCSSIPGFLGWWQRCFSKSHASSSSWKRSWCRWHSRTALHVTYDLPKGFEFWDGALIFLHFFQLLSCHPILVNQIGELVLRLLRQIYVTLDGVVEDLHGYWWTLLLPVNAAELQKKLRDQLL